jgi:hypothetical protein
MRVQFGDSDKITELYNELYSPIFKHIVPLIKYGVIGTSTVSAGIQDVTQEVFIGIGKEILQTKARLESGTASKMERKEFLGMVYEWFTMREQFGDSDKITELYNELYSPIFKHMVPLIKYGVIG